MNYLYLLLVIYLFPLIAFITKCFIIKKYSNIDNKKELSGFEIARNILDKHDLKDMYIVEKKGDITDNFDTNQNVIRLSTPVFHDESLYSLAISAYFATKAYLFNKNDKMIRTKLLIDNFVNLLITFIYLLLLVGLILNSVPTYKVVLILLILVVLYYMLTIPIEAKIIETSMKELSSHKYLDKNKDTIKTIYNIMNFSNISQIVITLSNLYYNIKDELKK